MRFHLLTLGCPKNVVDSEAMAAVLATLGHVPVAGPDDADLIIVNTCGFLAAAREEALAELRGLAAAKRSDQLLVAAGCLAQRDGDSILQQVPEVNGLLGTRRWMEIGTLLERLQHHRADNAPPVLLDNPAIALTAVRSRRAGSQGWAYLKISDGCDASCAFCTIPAIKGAMRSQPVEPLVAEAMALAGDGAQELVLICQDTTSYGRDLGMADGLPLLLKALLTALPDLRWLRLMYAYPGRISEELVEVMASDPRVCHYLDLPLQHGHPDTLRRMRRPANVEQTMRQIEHLRSAMPDIALRSTFIVGYPGETDAEFQALIDLLETVRLDKVGVFMFSSEPGTMAAELPNPVPPEVQQERYERTMVVQQRISLESNEEQVGRRLDVLVEGVGDGLSVGRCYRDAPEVDGLVLIGGELPVARMTPVTITGAMEYDLIGELA